MVISFVGGRDKSGKEAPRELSLGRNSSFVDLAANDFSPGLIVALAAPQTGTSVDSTLPKASGGMGCGGQILTVTSKFC